MKRWWPLFRDVPAVLYEALCATLIPRAQGRASMLLYRSLYAGFSIGPGARCWGRLDVTMDKGSSIEIGRELWAVSSSRRAGIALYSGTKLRTMTGARISLGDRVHLNGTSITARTSVTVGSGTMVAANVVIVDSDFHAHSPPSERSQSAGIDLDRPVVIGSNVWIGVGSIVLKGVTIGDNSIIGAGSVVTTSIPADVLAAGVPATVIRPVARAL